MYSISLILVSIPFQTLCSGISVLEIGIQLGHMYSLIEKKQFIVLDLFCSNPKVLVEKNIIFNGRFNCTGNCLVAGTTVYILVQEYVAPCSWDCPNVFIMYIYNVYFPLLVCHTLPSLSVSLSV